MNTDMLLLLQDRIFLAHFKHLTVFRLFHFSDFQVRQKSLDIIVQITFIKNVASTSLIDLGHEYQSTMSEYVYLMSGIVKR